METRVYCVVRVTRYSFYRQRHSYRSGKDIVWRLERRERNRKLPLKHCLCLSFHTKCLIWFLYFLTKETNHKYFFSGRFFSYKIATAYSIGRSSSLIVFSCVSWSWVLLEYHNRAAKIWQNQHWYWTEYYTIKREN